MDMNVKVQGSRSGKALGIGELLASASSASTPLDSDHRYHYIPHDRKVSRSGKVQR